MTNQGKLRQSNFELLRVLAMSMIVIHHFIYHGHIAKVFNTPWINELEAVVIFGVDIFIMISGYFTIKLTSRNFFNLAFTVFIFSVVNIITPYILNLPSPERSRTLIDITLFPLSRNEYWFIQMYAGLMVVSPFLNVAISNLNRHNFTKFVGILIAFNCYGHFIGSNMGDGSGMSLFMFITCYYTGALIRKWQVELRQIPTVRIITPMLTALAFVITLHHCINNTFSYFLIFKYSSPYVIGMSACLVILFSRIRLQRYFINILGASALGVYLLQDGVIGSYIYKFISDLNYTTTTSLLILIGLFILYWIGSLILSSLTNKTFPYIYGYISGLCRLLNTPLFRITSRL